MVNKVISKPQNVFVRGSQIVDSVVITNKSTGGRLRFGESGVPYKVMSRRPAMEFLL